MGGAFAKAGSRQIGEGTFATVCVVPEDDQNKAYVVKRLKRQSSAVDVGLFKRESVVLGSMHHG